jgi:hypothetical protein
METVVINGFEKRRKTVFSVIIWVITIEVIAYCAIILKVLFSFYKQGSISYEDLKMICYISGSLGLVANGIVFQSINKRYFNTHKLLLKICDDLFLEEQHQLTLHKVMQKISEDEKNPIYSEDSINVLLKLSESTDCKNVFEIIKKIREQKEASLKNLERLKNTKNELFTAKEKTFFSYAKSHIWR